MATIDDFSKITMQIGTILTAEYIEGADKLLKLSVDFGSKPTPTSTESTESDEGVVPALVERDVRQILSGIREYYAPEELIGKQCPFVTNLPVRTMRGFESHGMILAVGLASGGAVLLHPDREVPNGSTLR